MENLYLKQSPLTPISRKMQNFVLSESFVVNFVLQPMGSFQDEHRRKMFNQMVTELEAIPRYSMGSKGTNLWTRDYEAVSILRILVKIRVLTYLSELSGLTFFTFPERTILGTGG
jgi:hypothetical protein